MPGYLSLISTSYPSLISAARFSIAALANRAIPIIVRRERYFSTRANLTHMPHAFSRAKAAEIISNYDQGRLFAPTPEKTSLPIFSNRDPLKAVFVPVCGVNAKIASTVYEGEIGRDRTETYTTTDSEGKSTTTTRTVTDWYYTKGTLNSCTYTPENQNMMIYFGEHYYDKTIERALEGCALQGLKPFNANNVSKEIQIDPWKKVDAYGLTEAANRIQSGEVYRAGQHIRNNNWWVDHVRVNRLTIRYSQTRDGLKQFGLNGMMLPFFMYQNSNEPARAIAAISPNVTQVIGSAPVSGAKVMAATTVASTLLSFLFPQVAVPVRVMMVVSSAIASGAWAHLGLFVRNSYEERCINGDKENNAKFTRSFIDDERLNATTREAQFEDTYSSTVQHDIKVDAAFYEVLGLDPNQPITDEMIQAAFTKKLKSVHSDLGGNDASTIKVIEARNAFRKAINEAHDSGKRHFSTSTKSPSQNEIQLSTKTPPQSSPHPNTAYLIKLVLEEKNYKQALNLIKKGELNVDSHDEQENTLLTEAVKRKDFKGVQFALGQAKCAVDLSCDCPLHNTAMHYWAEGAGADNGKYREAENKIFALLIEHNARINLINSQGNTPLDMTKDETARRMLIAEGAVAHKTKEGTAGLLVQFKGTLFGYSPNARTKVIEEQVAEQAKLPSSNSKKS